MSSFCAVIPVTGLNVGFLGQVSRTGGGAPFIVSKEANALNANNITFGDTVVVLPDSDGGTYKQMADFIANGGGTNISVTTASSTTLTPANANLAGIPSGDKVFVFGPGISAGTVITAINYLAGTITISKAATASATVNLNFASFGGIAVREVKTVLTYPITPGTLSVGQYTPGQLTEAIVQGSICTKIYVGTPVAGGPIYVRAILNGSIPAGIVGGLESQDDGVNTILLPGLSFKSGKQDGNGIAEVTILNRITV